MTLFRRNNDVIIALCVRWDRTTLPLRPRLHYIKHTVHWLYCSGCWFHIGSAYLHIIIIKWPGHESDHPMHMIFTPHGNTSNSSWRQPLRVDGPKASQRSIITYEIYFCTDQVKTHREVRFWFDLSYDATKMHGQMFRIKFCYFLFVFCRKVLPWDLRGAPGTT